jgi:hypothetical protein
MADKVSAVLHDRFGIERIGGHARPRGAPLQGDGAPTGDLKGTYAESGLKYAPWVNGRSRTVTK